MKLACCELFLPDFNCIVQVLTERDVFNATVQTMKDRDLQMFKKTGFGINEVKE